MTCCSCKNAIVIVRGNDTNFNGQVFLTLNLTTNVLDLSTFSATFTLCGITKTFSDLSSGVITINYSAEETKTFPFGESYGVLKLFDSSNRVATIESKVPFNIVSTVSGDAIATRPYTLNFDVEQGGETILNVSVEAGVTVEVIPEVDTLPAGSEASVENMGTLNHLVLKFKIPEGNGIASIIKTSTDGLVDTYTLTYDKGNKSTFQITNGNGITQILKTGTAGLVDTYTIYFDNGQSTTFTVTNGEKGDQGPAGENASIIIRRL